MQAQSLGGEIVCKNEKPTFRSALSSVSADTHTKVVYERVDKHFKVTNWDHFKEWNLFKVGSVTLFKEIYNKWEI